MKTIKKSICMILCAAMLLTLAACQVPAALKTATIKPIKKASASITTRAKWQKMSLLTPPPISLAISLETDRTSKKDNSQTTPCCGKTNPHQRAMLKWNELVLLKCSYSIKPIRGFIRLYYGGRIQNG